MPEWLTWGIAMVGLLGGSGGIAAYLRARGQNRIDDRRQLTDEQIAFRQSLAAELAVLRQQVAELDKSKDSLETVAAEQGKQIAVLTRENEYQAREMQAQAEQIAQLREQNGHQAQQIETLTDERQQYIEKLAVVQARAAWLEAELNVERQDNQRLREQLPQRVEVDKA